MTKIRKFFGIGTKPRKKVQTKRTNVPDNFIFGSTNQKVSNDKNLSKSEDSSKLDVRTDVRK